MTWYMAHREISKIISNKGYIFSSKTFVTDRYTHGQKIKDEIADRLTEIYKETQ